MTSGSRRDKAPVSPLNGLHLLYHQLYIIAQGQILAAHHKMLAPVHRDQHLFRLALAQGHCHVRRDLPHQGIGDDDAHGPDDDIRPPAPHNGRVLSCGSGVRPGLQHGGSGDAVGADGQDLVLRKPFPDLFHHAFSHAAALAVHYHDRHIPVPLFPAFKIFCSRLHGFFRWRTGGWCCGRRRKGSCLRRSFRCCGGPGRQ